MRETKFIKQNKEKWEAFEKELAKGSQRNVEKLNELFIQITDDLSYSRTFYPNRSVRVYLNGLAQQIFFRIYKKGRAGGQQFSRFWSEELPRLVYEARVDFRISFLVFASAMLIGALSSQMDPEFPSVIMGDSYVEMTKANIESGDPMAVYKEKGEFQMFLGITLNNMLVAVRTFLMGALFLVGTLVILIYNGIMVGAFQYFFVDQGLFVESFLTIWMHGTLEISAIIIAGAAGLTMGRGLVFPGTYSRLQSFRRSGRRGLKILLGTLPLFLVAGFIEGYFTRYTDAPNALRAVSIGLCLLFVVFYFVLYPVYRARRVPLTPGSGIALPPSGREKIAFDQILSAGEVFSRLFIVYRQYFSFLILICALSAGFYTAFSLGTSKLNPSETFIYPAALFGTFTRMGQFFYNNAIPFLPLVILGIWAFLLATTQHILLKMANPNQFKGRFPNFQALGQVLMPAAGLTLLLYFVNPLTWFAFLLLAGPLLLWSFTAQANGLGPIRSMAKSLNLLIAGPSRIFGIFLIVFLFGFTIFNLIDSPLFRGYFDLLSWVVALSQDRMDELTIVWLTLIYTFMLFLILTTFILSIGLTYFSLLEIRECPGLKERIDQLGLHRTIKGLETEE